MWVRAKTKTQLTAATPDLIIKHSVQECSKWLAFYEPDVEPNLSWRVNHRKLNIRVSEERFREMFEEV